MKPLPHFTIGLFSIFYHPIPCHSFNRSIIQYKGRICPILSKSVVLYLTSTPFTQTEQKHLDRELDREILPRVNS